MATVEKFDFFPRGNYVDGYVQDKLLVRTETESPGTGGKSPRDSKGKLILRPNTWSRYKHFANFQPGKTSVKRNILRNGKYYLVEDIYYSYPEYWTNLARHILPSGEPRASNRALKKFYDAILENKASMAQTFAERQQAIDMVAQKATQVFNAYRQIRKGKFQRAARTLGLKKTRNPRSKQASGQWLELQYGWLPLLGDIHTLLNFNPFAGDKISKRATERCSYRGRLGATVVTKETVEYGALISVTDPMVGFANQAGLLNPGLLAWELMPFSFVVDWFLPVGDHLDYLTALCGLTITDGYKSTKIVRDITLQGSKSGLMISAHEEKFDRTLWTKNSLGIPTLKFTNPISPIHIANAVALGRQLKG